jgi:FMN reductase
MAGNAGADGSFAMQGRQPAATGLVVLGIGGGLRPGSTSLAALRYTLDAAAEAGATCELFDLNEFRLPLYDASDRGDRRRPPSPEVQFLLAAVRRADAFLWSSPGYHGTVSGAFKNALDYFEHLSQDTPPYISGKPVGLISTAGGTIAAVQAITAMTHSVYALRGWPVPLIVPIGEVGGVFSSSGAILSDKIATRLQILSAELVRFAALARGQPAAIFPHS